MKWLVDECVDAALVKLLRGFGYDVTYVADIEPAAADHAVISRAYSEGRLLVTDDKDFGDLVYHRSVSVPGLVLLRIDQTMRELRARRLTAAVERFGGDLIGRYTIIEEARFRYRPLLH